MSEWLGLGCFMGWVWGIASALGEEMIHFGFDHGPRVRNDHVTAVTGLGGNTRPKTRDSSGLDPRKVEGVGAPAEPGRGMVVSCRTLGAQYDERCA